MEYGHDVASEKTLKSRASENYPPPIKKEKVEDLVAFECSLQLFQEGVKVNLLITTMQFFDPNSGPQFCLPKTAPQVVTQHHGFCNFFHGFAPVLAFPLHHSICIILANL